MGDPRQSRHEDMPPTPGEWHREVMASDTHPPLVDAEHAHEVLADALSRLAEAEADAAPLPASYVAGMVATRPAGGKRRAAEPEPTRRWRKSAPQTAGRRIATDGADGLLLNATDAANHLAMACAFWDATQILSHPEVARMALVEALKSLGEERDQVGDPRFSWKNRRALADLQRQAAVILQASELLAAAHQRNLIRGD